MLRIFRYLYSAWAEVLVIIALLIVQAVGDLALPEYTSNIVDVGIQQSGIESAATEVIRESEFDTLSLFMSEEEQSVFKDNYKLISKDKMTGSEYDTYVAKYPALENQSLYVLNTTDEDTLEKLNDILGLPMVTVSQIGSMDFEAYKKTAGDKLPATVTSFAEVAKLMQIPVAEGEEVTFMTILKFQLQSGMISADSFTENIEKMSSISDSMISQAAVSYVKAEYEAIGIDVGAIQQNYLFVSGGQMLLIALMMMAVSIVVGLIASKVAARIGMKMRERVFKKVISFSSAEMDKFSTASLITRSTNDIQQIQMVIVMMLRMVIYAPILGIGGVLKVLSTNTSMSWIIGVAVGAILCLVITLVVIAMPKFNKMQTLVDKLNLVTREILTGLPVIRAFSREKHEEKRFDAANKDLTSTMLFTNRVMTFMMPAMMLIMNGITVLIIWVGANGISDGALQVGDMMAFISYTMQIVMSFLMLTMISIMLPRAAVSAKRIDEVLTTEVTIKDSEKPIIIEQPKGEVVFDNVSFRYPDADEYVLSDISFTAKAGQTTAIIGSTGSGKSTLVHLLPRFFDVTEGKITIDGVDIRDLSQKDLRAMLGFIPQKGILFSGTIASNLRFGAENADDERLQLSAEIAQAADFIREKPDGFDEAISQGGTNVSGGQKQRLSIARAIAKNPNIYIFDDSFSALDYKTDIALRRALAENVKESTVIIVAQRISTILHAEQIIVLDEGKIAGIGNHNELMKTCEVYRQIASSQLSEEELNNEKEVAENGN